MTAVRWSGGCKYCRYCGGGCYGGCKVVQEYCKYYKKRGYYY